MKKASFAPLFLTAVFFVSPVRAEAPDCKPSELRALRSQAKSIADRSLLDQELGPLLGNASGENKQWMGVGALTKAAMNCTVNLIEPPGGCEPSDDAPALVATNGHCVGLATKGPNVRRNEDFEADISFNHFQDSRQRHVQAKADRIVYANMQTKDLAVLRLNMTYGELRKKGVKPFRIAKTFEGGPIRNVAVPTDGVPNDQRYLRGNQCSSGPRRDVLEGNFLWRDQVSFDCPAVGGSSGSGLFNEKTGELMGLLNTGINEKEPGMPCRFNGPCSVDAGGIHPEKDVRYGFDLSFLHRCASKTCEIDPALESCPLPGSAQVSPAISSPTNSLDEPINLENPVMGRDFKAYRVKMGPAATTDCSDPAGYSEVSDFRYQPPKENRPEGAYVICSYGQDKNGTWQTPKEASTRGIRLDRTPTTVVLTPAGNGRFVQVAPSDGTDPIRTFQYKFADREGDCQSAKGYKNPPVQWGRGGVSTDGAKGKYLCVVGYDMAGNRQTAGTSYYVK